VSESNSDASIMLNSKRNIPALLLIYAGVCGTLALGTGYAFSYFTAASGENAKLSRTEKTVLDQRIASARQIREALSRPLPPPEPLPPITAKVAKHNNQQVAAREQRESREAAPSNFASISILSTVTLRPGLGADRSDAASSRTPKRDRLAGW
jgi:hypothetical protein